MERVVVGATILFFCPHLAFLFVIDCVININDVFLQMR